MNKSTFKKLRSEFRKCSSNAYYESNCGESFSKAVSKNLSAISHPEFNEKLFRECEKPVLRDLIVSMPIFRVLGYPFADFSDKIGVAG